MRVFALSLVALSFAAAARASFDMMIIPDASGTRYTRFDPINRVALGDISIGGAAKVTAIASNPNGIYQYADGHMSVNNSTGEVNAFPSFAPTSVFTYSPFSGLLAQTDPGLGSVTFGSLNANGVYTSSTFISTPSGFTTRGIIPISATSWVVYGTNAAGIQLLRYSSSGVLTDSVTNAVASSALLGGTGAMGQGAYVAKGPNNYLAIPYRDQTGAHRLLNITVQSSIMTVFNQQVISNYASVNSSTTLSAVAGHSGFFVVGADQSTPTLTRITAFDNTPPFSIWNSYTTNAVSAPNNNTAWRMANVVAPEPGTMAALALGLAAITRLRRKKKSA